MTVGRIITFILSIGLIGYAALHFSQGIFLWAVVKLIIGLGLLAITFIRNRYGLILFGHVAIVAGCITLAGGILLVPALAEGVKANGYQIPLAYIFGTPLFWGLFAIFGGLCAIYHGFCRCITGRAPASACQGRDESRPLPTA